MDDLGFILLLAILAIAIVITVWIVSSDKSNEREEKEKLQREYEEKVKKEREYARFLSESEGNKWKRKLKTQNSISRPSFCWKRHLIYDKYAGHYIQIGCDESSLEKIISDCPDFELVKQPTKELWKKVTEQIIESVPYKEVNGEHGGRTKDNSTKKERARFFKLDYLEKTNLNKTSDKELYAEHLKEREEFEEKKRKYTSLSEETKKELILSHDIQYKDYILKNAWLIDLSKAPTKSYSKDLCYPVYLNI